MRKVLSFVLVLALVLSSFSMAFAAQAPDLVGEDFEIAAGALMDLGVINGYPDGTFGGEKQVTRAEMAAMVCQALGLSEASGNNTFKDSQGHWAGGWIGLAQSLGIITGYGDGTFRPDNNVTDNEAVTMIVKALGYNQDSLPGLWPSNYIARAQKEGILDGVKITGENAVRGTIATMLYQTLAVPVGTTDKDGKWTADIRNNKYVTMYTLLGATSADEVVLRSTSARTNLMPYVGAYATVYRDSKTKDILAVADVKTEFLAGNFTTTSGNLRFEDVDGVVYNVPNDDVDHFYNAEEGINSSIAAILAPTGEDINDGDCVISVDIVGKTIRQVYAIMEWVADDDFQFEKADAEDISEHQELGSGEFTTTRAGEIDENQFQLLGVNALDDIKVDNIVAVYADSDDVITRIEVGTEVVSGEITRVSEADSDGLAKVTVDGTRYDQSSLAASSNKNIVAGNEVKLFLDNAGDWYCAELISGKAENIAIVLGREDGDASKLTDKNAKVELFMADGTSKVFTVAKDAVHDGSGHIVATASFGISSGAAVKYGLNSSGEINSITSYGALTNMPKKANVTAKGNYDGKEFASNAVFFTHPNVSGFATTGTTNTAIDSGDMNISKLDNILDTDDVDAIYYLDDKGRIEVMFYEDVADDDVYGFLLSTGKNNSSAGRYVELLIDGKSVIYDTAKTFTNYTSLYAITVTDNEVTSDGGNAGTTEAGLTIQVSDTATPVGIKVNGNLMTLTSGSAWITPTVGTGLSWAGTFDPDTDAITLASDVVVYVWNKDDSVYKAGKTSDLRSATMLLLYDTDNDDVIDVVAITKP